jgi:hypothetical protein
MANRSSRSVGQLEPFRPKGALPEGLPEVQRPGDAAAGAALADAGNSLAKLWSDIADNQAKTEGARDGRIAGADKSWRPDGSTTIRGRAFETAATTAYLDTLDADMRRRMTEAAEANRDNPAAMRQAMDAVKADIMTNDAFPEVKASVNAQFERLRLPFQVRANEVLIERQNDQARATALRSNIQSEATAAKVAEIAPFSPEAQKVIDGEVTKVKERNRQLISQGAMKAEDAAAIEIKLERDMQIRQSQAAVERLKTVEDVDRAEAEFTARKAAGTLGAAGQDARIMDATTDQLARRRQQLQVEGRRVVALTEKTADDMLARAQNGTFPPADEIAQMRSAAAITPAGRQIFDRFERRLDLVRQVHTSGAEPAEAYARRLRREAGPTPNAEAAGDIAFAEDLAASRRKAVTEDGIGTARKSGVVAVEPLNFADPAALAAGVRARTAAAAVLPGNVNPEGHIFEPEELKMATRLIQGGGEKAVATIEALVAGAGKDAPRLMRQIGGQAPELSQAGLLMAQGASRQVAREIIAGVALRELPEGSKLKSVDVGAFGKVAKDVLGSSLIDTPDMQSRVLQSARTVAAFRLRNETDMKGAAAQEVYRQAIQDVLGRQKINDVEFGGVAKVKPGWWNSYPVPVPPEVRSDRFKDVIGAIRDEDLAGKAAAGVKAATVRQAIPVAVPGGYRFAMEDPAGPDPKFLRGADGGMLTLRWDDLKGPLRSRVPGAFIGGGN